MGWYIYIIVAATAAAAVVKKKKMLDFYITITDPNMKGISTTTASTSIIRQKNRKKRRTHATFNFHNDDIIILMVYKSYKKRDKKNDNEKYITLASNDIVKVLQIVLYNIKYAMSATYYDKLGISAQNIALYFSRICDGILPKHVCTNCKKTGNILNFALNHYCDSKWFDTIYLEATRNKKHQPKTQIKCIEIVDENSKLVINNKVEYHNIEDIKSFLYTNREGMFFSHPMSEEICKLLSFLEKFPTLKYLETRYKITTIHSYLNILKKLY